jgi:hypothetical protein
VIAGVEKVREARLVDADEELPERVQNGARLLQDWLVLQPR